MFESCAESIIEQTSWLSGLGELTIHGCPNLTISHTLPPSSSVCRLSIARVSTLPVMKGSTNGELTIMGHCGWDIVSGSHDKPTKLDDILSFHHLRALTSLQLENCLDRFSPNVLPEHASEEMADANFHALPSLKHLWIYFCGITGKRLSVMLRHAPRAGPGGGQTGLPPRAPNLVGPHPRYSNTRYIKLLVGPVEKYLAGPVLRCWP